MVTDQPEVDDVAVAQGHMSNDVRVDELDMDDGEIVDDEEWTGFPDEVEQDKHSGTVTNMPPVSFYD